MKGKIAKIYISICLLFVLMSAVTLTVMGIRSNKYADSENNEIQRPGNQSLIDEKKSNFLVDSINIPEETFEISLPESVKESDLEIQNLYMEHKLQLTIHKSEEANNLSKNYFSDHPIFNHSDISSLSIEENDKQIDFYVTLNSIYEYNSHFIKDQNGENKVRIELISPKEKYSRIVVLDAGHGGDDQGIVVKQDRGTDEKLTDNEANEKDLSLSIVKKAGELIEKQGIKVYYTRQDESNPDMDQRVNLANSIQADMLLSVHADSTEDTSIYGLKTLYNGTFFIPDFGSADFGYLLLEKVAAETNEKAIGLEEDDGSGYLLQNATVPVAQLNIGYLSNRQEAKLLKREDYQDKIAMGILGAVEASYKEMEK